MCGAVDFTVTLRASFAFRIAPLCGSGAHPGLQIFGSTPMADLIYLILGLAGFALAALGVRAIERM
jgi:hypothetical protein